MPLTLMESNVKTHEYKTMSDGQIEFALRNIRAKIREDQDGYFDADAVSRVLNHSPLSGPELLRAMARASLGILPAHAAEKIITNRSKALYAYIVLQDRIGEKRLRSHLCEQSDMYMRLAMGAFPSENRLSR